MDEEVAGADLADDTGLQAREVEGDEVRAEAQALGDEPAEKDNVSEDKFAAGEQGASYIEHITKSKKRATLAGEKEQRKSKKAKIVPRRFLD